MGVMASFQAFQNPPPPAQETLTENQTGSCEAAGMRGAGSEARVTSSYHTAEGNQQVGQAIPSGRYRTWSPGPLLSKAQADSLLTILDVLCEPGRGYNATRQTLPHRSPSRQSTSHSESSTAHHVRNTRQGTHLTTVGTREQE